jgi:mono/diheme cytochrome c family protein
MQRYGLGVVVWWWTLLGIALAAEQRPPTVPSTAVSEGQRLFARYCSACHGVHGHGDGPAAPALQPPPADLTRIAQRHDGLFPVAEVTASIDGRTVIPAHGSREMPVWGARLGERAGGGSAGEEVVRSIFRVLIEYLQAIQQ